MSHVLTQPTGGTISNAYETILADSGSITAVGADSFTLTGGFAITTTATSAPDTITLSVDPSAILLTDLGDVTGVPTEGDVLIFRTSTNSWAVEPSTSTDEFVKASSTDTTSGRLDTKLSAGNGIALTTLNPGGNESVEISNTNVFGSEFQRAESFGFSTTTSTTFQNKVKLTTTNLPAGTYRIGIHYGWNHNSTINDFEGQVLEDAVQLGEIHKQEPKDSAGGDPTGTTQRYYTSRVFYRTLTAGVHVYDINFRTDSAGTVSSIWEATIELWRVS